MQTRFFALVLGVFYLGIGILGLIPALYTSPPSNAPTLDVTSAYGFLFGQFPVNAVHDVFNIVIGVAGIIAGSRLEPARYYCIFLFFVLGLLACIGFMPQANTLWGKMPIFGSDTWIHMVTAIAAGYFGYVATESTHVEPAVAHVHT
jgi:Domain of unknown function (DUF4383)